MQLRQWAAGEDISTGNNSSAYVVYPHKCKRGAGPALEGREDDMGKGSRRTYPVPNRKRAFLPMILLHTSSSYLFCIVT